MATKERTELQEMIEVLVMRGDLNLENRRNIHYPMRFTKEFEDKYIEELTDDNRTLNALRRFGCKHFSDLIEHWNDVSRVKNMGTKSIALAHNALLDKYYQSLDVEGKAKFLGEIIRINNKPIVEEGV